MGTLHAIPSLFLTYPIIAVNWNLISKEALAIRCIFSLVDMITTAKFSNSPNDLKICLFG